MAKVVKLLKNVGPYIIQSADATVKAWDLIHYRNITVRNGHDTLKSETETRRL